MTGWTVALVIASALAAIAAWQAIGLACDEGFRELVSARAVRALSTANRKARGMRGSRALTLMTGHKEGVISALSRGRLEKARRGKCLDELPELIDVVVLGLSAGISFDASLAIYCDRYQTMLSALLSEAMRSWQLGFKNRQQALKDLSESLKVDAFSAFVDTVCESLAFGTPLAKTLVEQGDAVRDRRKSDVEERIEKTPVKMIIPIGTLVLPAMLLAIMGPLFASLMQVA